MQADILDALATYLSTDDLPVYYIDMPASLPVDASELPQFAVVTPGGNAPSAGDRSYIKVARPRADIRCYGPTGYFALKTYRTLADQLKAIKPVTVTVDGVGVLIHNAELSSGPTSLIDPETKWPLVIATWGVHGSEVELPTGSMFSRMFSEMFA